MRRFSRLFLTLTVLLIAGCAVFAGCADRAYERIASDRYDGPVSYLESPAERFMLAVEEQRHEEQNAPIPYIRFFVYDRTEKRVTYERNAAFQGSVQWEDEEHLLVKEIAGIARAGNDTNTTAYRLDVRTGDRTPVTGKNQ